MQKEAVIRHIAVRAGRGVMLVRPTEVDWIEAADNYVRLHCGRVTHIIRTTLGEVEARLEWAGFLRLHRSAVVNVDRVKSIQPWFRGDLRVVLLDGTELTLKRQYRAAFEGRLLLGSVGR